MPISKEAIRGLRAGKDALRAQRRNAPLEQKIQELRRAQQLYVAVVGARRPLTALEQPWDIMSDVKDAVTIEDGVMKSTRRPISASSSRWIPSPQRWILKG
jgi:hypothetical protein